LGHPYFLTFDRLLELHASFFFLTRNMHSLLDNVVKNFKGKINSEPRFWPNQGLTFRSYNAKRQDRNNFLKP
jgi:hypothetical protein